MVMVEEKAKSNENMILNGICVLLTLIALGAAASTLASGEINVDNLFFATTCLMLAVIFAINPGLELLKSMREEEVLEGAAGAHAAEHTDHTIFYMVWIGLLVLTIVEVVLAYLQFSIKVMLVTLLGLSLVKSAMIMAYFMHLKFERRSLVLTLVPITVVLIALFAVFFPDSLRVFNLATFK